MISFFNHGSWTSLIYGETRWQSLRRCNGIVRTWSSDILHGADLTYWYYFSVTLLVDGNWRDGSYCGRRLTTISCDNVPSGPAVDSKAHSTVFMVTMLVTVVGSVFILFALMALCYRSVVVHRNLSLCLRLVESLHAVPLFPPTHSYSQTNNFWYEPIFLDNIITTTRKTKRTLCLLLGFFVFFLAYSSFWLFRFSFSPPALASSFCLFLFF